MTDIAQSAVFGRRREPHTVIIARGDEIVHFTVRPWLVAALISALALAAVGYLLATSYLVFRDDLISGGVAHDARMQQAYEDRIAALRNQVDRIESQQLLDRKAVEKKVGELLKRQSLLANRHGRLQPLLKRAKILENGAADNAGGKPGDGGVPEPAPGSPDHVSADPVASTPLIADASPTDTRGPAAFWGTRNSLAGDGAAADPVLSGIKTSLGTIEADQITRVKTLSDKAWRTGTAITAALKSAGLKVADDYGKSDVGGPLIAPENPVKFDVEVKQLDAALDRLDLLKVQIRKMPIANPEPGAFVTSGFGLRRDPIAGVMALHPGIDFRAAVGTTVRATAAGTVTRAGWAGGYGNMIEINHGNGYATRYGHLSRIDVTVGQKIGFDEAIGKTGSTGRSTGPHLHYEIRHNGVAVDPVDFIKVGKLVHKLL